MAKQNVYQIEGKTPDEVKTSFIYYMGDKNATSKQIKDAANSRYAKIDTIDTVCNIVKRTYKVENVFYLTDVAQIVKVSDELTSLIEKGGRDTKEHKNQRSYVN